MKLKDKITFGKNEENIVLLAALGIIALNSPISTAAGTDVEKDENTTSVNALQSKTNYITKMKQVLAMNDYAPIKTLYKLQSVIDDIAVFSASNVVTVSDESDLGGVLNEISPYMSRSKKDKIDTVMNNVDRTRKTYEDIRSVRGKIVSLPPETTKTQRMKAIFNEIPNISGIPMLNSLNNLRSVVSMIKSQARSDAAIAQKETDTTQNTVDAEFEEIRELMEMFEKKK